MIPKRITNAHIEEAIRLIIRDGMPPGRRSRGYCLATKGEHFPPKYTIALASQVATGELLPSDRFSGGPESNEFLRRRGFAVIECDCRGSVRDGPGAAVPPPSVRRPRTSPSKPHSERCHACKVRVGQLLDRIYGACVLNHRFPWQTGLAAYSGTSINPVLRDVAGVLEGYRGYGVGTFVRTQMLAGCDYWVPDPGFIVEFDESQHFTSLRKLALAVYADGHPLGFAARRWLELCEQHDARDNDPSFRDEQRSKRGSGGGRMNRGFMDRENGRSVGPRKDRNEPRVKRKGQQHGRGGDSAQIIVRQRCDKVSHDERSQERPTRGKKRSSRHGQ